MKDITKFINNLKTKPFQHQIEGIKFGIEHNRFLLGDSMGLGKTAQVINIAAYKKENFNYSHCLIICGVNGLKWNWCDEIKIHSDIDYHVLGYRKGKKTISNKDKLYDLENFDSLPFFIITNIETLRYKVKTGKQKKIKGKLKDIYEYPITDILVELCNSGKINMIAVDEFHTCKNPESLQGKQLLRLSTETEIAMTGTPLLNSPLDLYMPLNWLGYEEHSFFQYKVHYCRLGGFGGHEIIGYKHLEQLQEKLNSVMLRRRKEDVLDLPEKLYSVEYVEMDKSQLTIYNEVREDLLLNIDKIESAINPLAELIRLRQATGHTSILSSKISESAKLERLIELIDEIAANDEKTIIFSNWSAMTSIIYENLTEYNPALITGEVADADRESQITKFQKDNSCKVIIGTIGAMGTGLNLTAANNVIFYDIPWTKGIYEQAVDRCHRIGQNKTIYIKELITKDTIDERIHNIVWQKGEVADFIVDKKSTVKYLLS